MGPPGSGDDSQVYTWRNGLVELPDGLWAMPYAGYSTLHNMTAEFVEEHLPQQQRPIQIGYALWQPHRFCGIEADLEGHFTIPPIYRHGDQLRLNYRCAPGGWIRVELLNSQPFMTHPDVDPVEGFKFTDCDYLTGDEGDCVVTWKGNSDISSCGEILVIRVRMFQAKLFAYRV